MLTENSKMDFMQNYSAVSLAIGIGYAAYYWFCIAKSPATPLPKKASSKRRPRKHPLLAGNIKYQKFIQRHCPLLCQRFLPTFWCPSARAQTILRVALKTYPKVAIKKEFLDLSDGGHVSLDWLVTDCQDDSPVVLILPGLTGNSCQSYALHLLSQVRQLGYRSVVFSYRGNGGAHLKTPKTYTACETGDLSSVIQHIKTRYPEAPLMALGCSLGGLILTNYLAKHGRDCGLLAGMTISSPWNLFKSCEMMEQPINRLIFNRSYVNHVKVSVKRSAALFEKMFNLDHVLNVCSPLDRSKYFTRHRLADCSFRHQLDFSGKHSATSQTIKDFDSRFTAPLFGYSSFTEYYDDARIDTKVHHIQIPLLALNATDDPMSPGSGLPLSEATTSKCVMIVATSHGGHLGFLEGILPTGPGYMDRVFAEFATAVFDHGDELRAELECEV